jgi:hypothetical protein
MRNALFRIALIALVSFSALALEILEIELKQSD